MQTRRVENADLEGRVPAAIRSQNDFIMRKKRFFRIFKRDLIIELQKTADPQRRAELTKAIQNNNLESRAFDVQIGSSTLRKHIRDKTDPDSKNTRITGIERRLLLPNSNKAESILTARTEQRSKAGLKLTGYAALFDSDSLNLGGFIEQIAPGAFTNALKKSDVRILINHDSNLLLGRTKSKSLRLYEDKAGLLFYNDLLDGDGVAMASAAWIGRGDMSGCSFTFTTKRDEWTFAKKPGELDRRRIIEISDLYDVGPVTFPAYPDTSVSVLDERTARAEEEIEKGYRRWVSQKRDDLARKKEVARQYRHAGRIINRIKAASLY